MKKVTFDFETRSQCDLKKSGAYKYSLHPTTQPTCLAFKAHGRPRVFFLAFRTVNSPYAKLPLEFRAAWQKLICEGYLFSAHNVFFDMCIYKNILVKRYGWPDIPFEQFRCTAAKAAACAIPRSLEKAGEAMKLTTQKDKRGYAAVMKTCKPTKKYGDWNKMMAAIQDCLNQGKALSPKQEKWFSSLANTTCPELFLEPEDDPDTWNTLYEYCKIDVRTEELLDDSLPDLTPKEQEIWLLNQQLNWRGIGLDVPTITKVVGMMKIESSRKLKELDTLTMGLVTKPGARQSILDFLATEGVELPDIRASTVKDALAGFDLSADMRQLLELRQALSKTSTKKYQAMLDRVCPDERARDILMYHGASTGRDSGTGLQVHNFPKNLISQKMIDQVFQWFEEGVL